ALAWLMVRFWMLATVAGGSPAWPAPPMKKTRKLLPPLTVMFWLPPLMTVPVPRISGSSLLPELPTVMVCPAIAFANVMVVPGLALAKVMASRSVGLALPLTVSALLVTTQDVPAHCAAASVAESPTPISPIAASNPILHARDRGGVAFP